MKFKLHCQRNYLRRKSFRSVYCFEPIAPPFKYFLSSVETASALGIKISTLTDWRAEWKRTGCMTGPGPRPRWIGPRWMYEWDQVIGAPRGHEFVALMRRDRKAGQPWGYSASIQRLKDVA